HHRDRGGSHACPRGLRHLRRPRLNRRRGGPQGCPRAAPLAGGHVAAHKTPMPIPAWLPILLGTLTAVGPLSIDMYLPAFPAMEAAFATPGKAPVTVAAFFVGLAIGQMTQGPLADRLGRRTPLLWGMSLYAAASVG